MRITVDTNLLLRIAVRDDVPQAKAALDAFETADVVAISVHALCEFAWVLRRRYSIERSDLAAMIRLLVSRRNVAINRPAVDAGLALLEAGGDFADGIIAYEGRWLGGDTFLSFDKKAVRRLEAQGHRARVPA